MFAMFKKKTPEEKAATARAAADDAQETLNFINDTIAAAQSVLDEADEKNHSQEVIDNANKTLAAAEEVVEKAQKELKAAEEKAAQLEREAEHSHTINNNGNPVTFVFSAPTTNDDNSEHEEEEEEEKNRPPKKTRMGTKWKAIFVNKDDNQSRANNGRGRSSSSLGS